MSKYYKVDEVESLIKWPDREYKTVEVEEFRNGGFNERSYARVAAWMPLPEPWKGADNV